MQYPIIINPLEIHKEWLSDLKRQIETNLYHEINKKVLSEYEEQIPDYIDLWGSQGVLGKDRYLKKQYVLLGSQQPEPPNKPEFDPFIDFNNPLAVILSIIFLPILLFGLLFAVIFYLRDLSDYSSDYSIYKKALKYYNSNIEKVNENNNKRHYHLNIVNYRINTMLKSKEFQNIITQELESSKKSFLKSTMAPQKSIVPVTRGLSEIFFLEYLKSYFDYTNITIMTGMVLNFYYPDFVIFHHDGLYVDVEIDEPYVGSSKKVIHYYDPKNDCFTDSARNEYFVENKWAVVRFAERQIFKEPELCCLIIADLINSIVGSSLMKDYSRLVKISKENIWTLDQADEMALFNFRNSYIPENFAKYF